MKNYTNNYKSDRYGNLTYIGTPEKKEPKYWIDNYDKSEYDTDDKLKELAEREFFKRELEQYEDYFWTSARIDITKELTNKELNIINGNFSFLNAYDTYRSLVENKDVYINSILSKVRSEVYARRRENNKEDAKNIIRKHQLENEIIFVDINNSTIKTKRDKINYLRTENKEVQEAYINPHGLEFVSGEKMSVTCYHISVGSVEFTVSEEVYKEVERKL